MLVDLGGVVDERGHVLSQQSDSELAGLPLFSRKFGQSIVPTPEGATEEKAGVPKKKLSIMGTCNASSHTHPNSSSLRNY